MNPLIPGNLLSRPARHFLAGIHLYPAPIWIPAVAGMTKQSCHPVPLGRDELACSPFLDGDDKNILYPVIPVVF